MTPCPCFFSELHTLFCDRDDAARRAAIEAAPACNGDPWLGHDGLGEPEREEEMQYQAVLDMIQEAGSPRARVRGAEACSEDQTDLAGRDCDTCPDTYHVPARHADSSPRLQ